MRNMRKALAGGFLLVGAVFLAFRMFATPSAAPIVVPTPIMPNPNAYDFYVRAGKALYDLEDINPARPPASKQQQLAQWQRAVRSNQKTLQLVRQGLQYEYRELPERSFWANAERMAQFSRFRNLCQLLQIQGDLGSSAQVADSYLDIVKIGSDMAQGGPTTSAELGYAIEPMGQHRLWRCLPQLNRDELAHAEGRLESISRVSLTKTLQDEMWFVVASLQERIPPSADPAVPTDQLKQYVTYVEALSAQARMPYGTHAALPPVPTDPSLKGIAPDFNHLRFLSARCQTQNVLLLTAMALRAYFLDHKAYPDNLNALVPQYLPAIPTDPFGTGPLRYRQSGSSYVLYSIGPDGRDDGGAPIHDPARTAQMNPYLVLSESKGDVVAGLNR